MVDRERVERLLARVADDVPERWPVAESNADAVRRLGAEGVVAGATARAVATAVGFRNVLVHQYVDVDEQRVIDNLGRLDDLSSFVGDVADWLSAHGGDET